VCCTWKCHQLFLLLSTEWANCTAGALDVCDGSTEAECKHCVALAGKLLANLTATNFTGCGPYAAKEGCGAVLALMYEEWEPIYMKMTHGPVMDDKPAAGLSQDVCLVSFSAFCQCHCVQGSQHSSGLYASGLHNHIMCGRNRPRLHSAAHCHMLDPCELLPAPGAVNNSGVASMWLFRVTMHIIMMRAKTVPQRAEYASSLRQHMLAPQVHKVVELRTAEGEFVLV